MLLRDTADLGSEVFRAGKGCDVEVDTEPVPPGNQLGHSTAHLPVVVMSNTSAFIKLQIPNQITRSRDLLLTIPQLLKPTKQA